jgi:hypothetical protein
MQSVIAIGVAAAILALIIYAKLRARKKKPPTCCQ